MSKVSQSARRRIVMGFARVCLAGLPLAPLSASVLELDANGHVTVRASDVPGASQQPMLSAQAGVTPEDVEHLNLPLDAVTTVAAAATPPEYSVAVEQLADTYGLSATLIEALVWQESRWHAGARSPAGAIGLAQLMPGTARDLGVAASDPNSNLAGGARYLRQQLDRFDGDIELALAAYNAGPARVMRARGIPNIAETQSYVRSIVNRLSSSALSQGSRP